MIIINEKKVERLQLAVKSIHRRSDYVLEECVPRVSKEMVLWPEPTNIIFDDVSEIRQLILILEELEKQSIIDLGLFIPNKL